jgi:hypothetical protein
MLRNKVALYTADTEAVQEVDVEDEYESEDESAVSSSGAEDEEPLDDIERKIELAEQKLLDSSVTTSKTQAADLTIDEA